MGGVKCLFCPCVFSSDEDLALHTVFFGNDKIEHVKRFKAVHGDFEGSVRRVVVGHCAYGEKVRWRPIFDAIDSWILCRDCHFFRG